MHRIGRTQGNAFRMSIRSSGYVRIWHRARPSIAGAGRSLHSNRGYAGMRRLARQRRRGRGPPGFLTVSKRSRIYPAGVRSIPIAKRVRSPSVRARPDKGPLPGIVVVGKYPEAGGYAPSRDRAQPVSSGNHFIVVESEFEHRIARYSGHEVLGRSSGHRRTLRII